MPDDDSIRLNPWSAPRALDDWLARTEQWSHFVSSAAGLPLHRRVLLELLEAIGGEYVGTDLEVQTDANTTRLVLDGIEITPTTGPRSRPRRTIPTQLPDAPLLDLAKDLWSIVPGVREVTRAVEQTTAQFNANLDRLRDAGRVRLDASNVRVSGGELERVTALVDDLRLEPGRTPTLTSGSIQLMVRTTMATAAQWIERALPGTVVRAGNGGRLSVRPAGSPWTFGVEPSIVGDELRAKVVRVARFGIDIGLPRRFVRTYTAPIPSPEPLIVVDAELVGDELLVHYRHPGIRHPVEIDRVRELMRRGAKRVNLADLGTP